MREINGDVTFGELLARELQAKCPDEFCGNKLADAIKTLVTFTTRSFQVEGACSEHLVLVDGVIQYEGKLSYWMRIYQ